MVRNPSVLLMDEPLSNLDAGLRVRTRTEIKRLQRELGITAIFVTHDQEEAMVSIGSLMRDGRLQQIGPPMDVYREPDNLFVASFIGSPAMNFLDVDLTRADGALLRLRRSELRLPSTVMRRRLPPALAAETDGRSSASGRAISRSAPIANSRSARDVFLVEPIGPVTYVDVDVGGSAIKAVCDPDQAPGVGDRVSLGFQAARVRLFDPATEARI